MRSMRFTFLLFILISCIASLTFAQDAHDHAAPGAVHDEHDHAAPSNATAPGAVHDEHDHAAPSNATAPGVVHDEHDHAHEQPTTNSPATATAPGTAHDHGHGQTGTGNTSMDTTADEHNHAEGEHHGHSHAAGYNEETCALELDQPYNLNFRIGSLFIILGTSAVGIFAPIILHRVQPYSHNGIRSWILTIGKFFGTGVVLATSFVHMLPEAMERFSSPCLSEVWLSYHAFGGVFCMIAAFVLQWIELAAMSHLDSLKKTRQQTTGGDEIMTQKQNIDPAVNNVENATHIEQGHIHSAGFLESDEEMSRRSISTLLLELGISIHSIIIGITLGTTSEETFLVLFIALIFHQFFEGVALGTRINDLNCKSWSKPAVMGVIFIVMTPIGVAIGIGIRSVMDVRRTILAQAILDALSAGILLYNAYISLMSVEINHSTSFRRSSLARKSVCLVSMYVGAGIMSVLGLWA